MKKLLNIFKFAVYVCAVPVAAALVAAGEFNPTSSGEVMIGSPKVLSRNHLVHLTKDGLVNGRVVAIDSMSKSQSPLSKLEVFFVHDGAIVGKTVTDNNGNFVADGLAPGAYSFIASGAKGFAAYGLAIEPYVEGSESEQIFSPTVSPRFRALRRMVERYLPHDVSEAISSNDIQTSLKSEADIVQGVNRVQLDDGRLSGTLSTIVQGQSVADSHIALIQNDNIVAETTSDADGKFAFADLGPGVYDFVAAGPTSFAALSFEAVGVKQQDPAPQPQDAGDQPTAAPEAASEPTAAQDAAGAEPVQQKPAQEEAQSVEQADSVFDVAVTPVADEPVVSDQVNFACDACGGEIVSSQGGMMTGSPLEQCGDAVGCGACAGSCGCGMDSGYYGGAGGYGGYSGVFGGLADLAQLALAGWLIGQLIDQIDFNDNNNPNNPPNSPAS